jgi:hypothetical protein
MRVTGHLCTGCDRSHTVRPPRDEVAELADVLLTT